ncbi:cytochrome P450 2A13-like [Rhinophrynus dorsalis]
MDTLPVMSLSLAFLLTLLFLISYWRQQRKHHSLPPGPSPLPLLGTPRYIKHGAHYKYYPELWTLYGPVFTIWQLSEPVVVLCGYDAVKDALINHADQFSGRPPAPVIDLYSSGYSFPSIHGRRWSQLRRFTLTSLRNLGMGKKSMELRVKEEAQQLIDAVSETGGKTFNPIHLLGCAVANITSCALLGERFHYEDQKLLDLITTTRRFIGNTHSTLHQLGNMFPRLLHIPGLREKFFKESSDLQAFVEGYIDLHKQTLDPSSPRDFIDFFLLKIKEEEAVSGTNFCDTSLLMTIISLLAAGTETTTSTLKYCLSFITHYPEVQQKVQQEIDDVTGSLRPPGITDRARMPYTNAVIHELQRILDLAPIAHYHAVTEDTQFRGFTIPKGTTVIPFISSVLSDPSQWETPEEFNPQHFLDDQGKFRTKTAFMVFSAGKRVCAGENLARMELFLLFCSLLQRFTFCRAPGSDQQDCRSLRESKMKIIMFSEVYISGLQREVQWRLALYCPQEVTTRLISEATNLRVAELQVVELQARSGGPTSPKVQQNELVQRDHARRQLWRDVIKVEQEYLGKVLPTSEERYWLQLDLRMPFLGEQSREEWVLELEGLVLAEMVVDDGYRALRWYVTQLCSGLEEGEPTEGYDFGGPGLVLENLQEDPDFGNAAEWRRWDLQDFRELDIPDALGLRADMDFTILQELELEKSYKKTRLA